MDDECKVPFHRPSIGEEEIREVEAALRSGWLTTGPRTHQFEEDVARYVDAARTVALSSATAGLHLSLAALDIGSGDEVITTPLTFCSTVNTILQVGATPVLADVAYDGNLDPRSVAVRITPRTKAIVPVHLAGLPCDMASIWELARQHKLRVIEDAAHAIGSRYDGHPIGSSRRGDGRRSDSVVFSFYATKNLTTGEGGMVATGDEELADRIRSLSLHGIDRSAWNRYSSRGNWYYEVRELGFKYNLTDIQSAIGIQQLKKLERMIGLRTTYASVYTQAFADMEELEVPPNDHRSRHAWHLYILRLNLDKMAIDRSQFIDELRRRGICASVHFIPIPLHPYFATQTALASYSCPEALRLYPRILSLPLFPAMTLDQVLLVCSSVKDIVQRNKRSTSVALSSPAGLGQGLDHAGRN